jgi:DNA polymerase-3 subunit epsilon
VDRLYARLKNQWLRRRLAGRDLPPAAWCALCAPDALAPDRPALSFRFVVVDLETTGLDLKTDRVISVGAFRIENGRIRLGDSFHELVDPGRDIPAESILVHGIVPDRIENARPAWAVFDDFIDYLGQDVLVAHHARFDLYFLNRVMRRRYGFKIQNPVLDTILMCRHALPDPDFIGVQREARRCSLDALIQHFNLDVPERHTALGDALATALIFQRLAPLMIRAGYQTMGQWLKAVGVYG